ncbi:hypothetical protein CRYUN_Cryun09bG0139700 [Craigia yunnanensis]
MVGVAPKSESSGSFGGDQGVWHADGNSVGGYGHSGGVCDHGPGGGYGGGGGNCGTVPREAAEEVPEMDMALVVDEAVVMGRVITITGKVNLVAIPLTGVATTRIESGVMI